MEVDLAGTAVADFLKVFTGKHHGESGASQALGLEIVGHMRSRMDEAARKHGLNFTLLATPAEGLSGRFVRMDRKRFGPIEGMPVMLLPGRSPGKIGRAHV